MVSYQNRGAFVDNIERFYHMLLFAMWISRDAGGVFKVELPMLHRRGAFEWLSHSWKARGNASVFPQESVNGAGRFRQPQLPFFYGFIPIQIIEDGDADPACGPALLGDRPGSLKVDLSPEGRVWQADDEGHGRAFQDSAGE